MQIAPFSIEQYFALYEFSTRYLLCASDCESMPVAELLQMAGKSVADLGGLHLGYTESQGHPDLRAAIAMTYESVDPGQVIMLTTPEEGIYLTMRTMLDPGDHVVVLTPAFDSLLNMAEHVSGNVSQWMVEKTDSGWALDLEELARLVTPATKLIVVNFPHNPSGYLPSLSEMNAIIKIARQNDTWVFCDEMYRGLELDGVSQLPSAADLYDRAISLTGLSKAHGLPGLRSGWLIIRDEKIKADLMNWKLYTSICAPAPSEFLTMAALKVQDELIARNKQIIENNLAAAESFFGRWTSMFEWRRPQAGSVALVGLDQPSATDYCHALAKDAGVLLLPSSCMGYGDKHVRFGFGRANFQENLAHYEQYLLRLN